jgi:SAM-dependent methyltransferase
VSPPLLGSRIRNDMLRAFLAPEPHDLVADLGCGSGRTLLWNRDWDATTIGIDISPFFSAEARRDVDLLIGDLRKLPFADGTFTKAFSLDVLEHLSPEALRGMLAEAARVLAPGGALFVYTHVRKNARIAVGLRWINVLARQLDRWGLIDLRQEHLRKSDHLNPLRDIPELEQVARAAGFRIGRIRYYTPIVGGFVENILMRMAERAMARRAAGRLGSGVSPAEADARGIREARTSAKERIASSPATYAALRALSFAMKLDLLLFGRIRSGPFFALLVKE